MELKSISKGKKWEFQKNIVPKINKRKGCNKNVLDGKFSKNESCIGSIFRTSAEHSRRLARVVPPGYKDVDSKSGLT